MTLKMEFDNGVGRRVMRSDAVKYRERWTVPTTNETKWVGNMEEFTAAGGMICFNEDQTEIELLLPEPYKFSIQFFKPAQ